MRIISRRLSILALALVGGCAFAWKPSAPAAQQVAKPGASLRVAPAKRAGFVKSYLHLPLSFEANTSQDDLQVKFTSRGAGFTLFLTGDQAILALRKGVGDDGGALASRTRPSTPPGRDHRPGTDRVAEAPVGRLPNASVLPDPKARTMETNWAGRSSGRQPADTFLQMQLVGANSDAIVAGADELPGRANYFIGNDPKKWRTNVATYAKVRYQGIYPGVDLVYYGNQGQLEYDFVVAPGANPNDIALDLGAGFSSPRRGTRDKAGWQPARLRLDAKGNLVIAIDGGEVRFQKPIIYQPAPSRDAGLRAERRIVNGRYRLTGKRVSFEVGAYNKSLPLVIDPALQYSTYLGGSGADYAYAIAVDKSGNAYVTGYTQSTNFPTTKGTLQTQLGTSYQNAFVTKLSPHQSTLIYSTYLGGNSYDAGYGIAVDAAGDAYLTGYAGSNFPTTPGAFQKQNAGSENVFVAELTPSGSSLAYSTYLGGSSYDSGQAIAIDSAGDAYVTGIATSTNFPNTPGVFQNSCSYVTYCQDAFVTEFNPTGTALVYSSYLGGSSQEYGRGIAVDTSGDAYVTGSTFSSDFPVTPGVFQTTLAGLENAFIAKVNPGGSQLVYSTYLGGTYYDGASAIAVDSSGDSYVAGSAASNNFPTTPGAFQTVCKTCDAASDGFVTKLNSAGTALVYSTFLGGSGNYSCDYDCLFGDSAAGVSIDAAGDAYVTGTTVSNDFPTTPGSFDPTVPTGSCGAYYCAFAFMTEFNPTGSSLVYSTYFGSGVSGYSGYDNGNGIAVSGMGSVFLAGIANDANFPTTAGAFQTTYGGSIDAFVSIFRPSPNAGLSPTSLSFPLQGVGTTSPPQTVVLTNTGNTGMSISGIEFSGTGYTDFTQTNTCGSSVAVGASCNIDVSFAPKKTGTLSANLTLKDNAPASPQTVSLTGTATAASVSISPSSLTFATQIVFTTSPFQTLTLTNTGTGPLTITSITWSANFKEASSCRSGLAPGASCDIRIAFDPTTSGSINGTVTIVDNAPNSPQTVPLSGTATAIQLSPSSLSFGDVTVGRTSPAGTISMENKSTTSVSITNIAITGTNASDFAETNNCGSTLVPGEICSISVTFSPTVTGALSASVTVTDNGGSSPQSAALAGTGVN